MTRLRSYLEGRWTGGSGPERRPLFDPATGDLVASVRSGGHDLGAALAWGRDRGGAGLRALGFRERGALVARLAAALRKHRDEFREVARTYGATPADARRDVDGGLSTLGYYGALGASLPDAGFLADGPVERLSRGGGFAGRHILVPREGLRSRSTPTTSPAGVRSKNSARRFSPGFRA